MSGPVRTEDVAPGDVGDVGEAAETADAGEVGRAAPGIEITPSHEATVGRQQVRRALPRRGRRTIGAWCFADHMGPASVAPGAGLDIGPHPHIGLQTVTWLISGELLHRDSLGSEQPIRPGQLNLMTAGRGVAHAEESTAGYRGELQGLQLWVAQPERTRHGEPAFEHHHELPRIELGDALVTVVVGGLEGSASPARRDTDHVGIDVAMRAGQVTLPVDPSHEHGVVVLEGAVTVDGTAVTPGHLAYLAPGRDELPLAGADPARLMVLGGTPFESPILMWWNFVARSREEVDEARADWEAGTGRFGATGSVLARIGAPMPPWARPGTAPGPGAHTGRTAPRPGGPAAPR